MSADKKWPFIQWFVSDWLGDPKVTQCEPATRGILFDWLCNMHALDRSGVITGPREELARFGRCSAVQCDAALRDLIRTNAADVTERNGVVTVTNRRMRREFLSRKNGSNRVRNHRDRDACNGPVTPHNQSPDSQNYIPEPEPTCPTNRTANGGRGGTKTPKPDSNLKPSPLLTLMALDRVAREIMSNRWGWAYDNCKVKITDFTSASLVTVLKPFADKVTEHQVQIAWSEAVRRAHGAYTDAQNTGQPVTSPAGYAVACFRELLGKISNTDE